jgi:protein SCO1/2
MSRQRAVAARRFAALAIGATVIVSACGTNEAHELTGYRREPAPMVGDITLPDLTRDGDDLALRAEPGHLLVIYFGYTNCPDFCPTTLSDLRLATRRMDEDPARIDTAMITVDPDRDLSILSDYITSFFDDGHALGTDDGQRLAEAAAPFGVSYDVSIADDGVVEVAHTTALYAVDDTGHLALTWQFGVSIDDLAADLDLLLESSDA